MRTYINLSSLLKKTFVIFLLPGSLALHAQTNNVLNEISNRFNQYQERNIPEKIFIHTDKNTYLAGEILWFKAYLADATFNKPLDISKICYIELINSDRQVVVNAKISLKNGSGDGSFYLPSVITTGNYHLRAYTSLMKSQGHDVFFERVITILNTIRENDVSLSENLPVHSAAFFPEGGNMVSGLESRVAFQVVNKIGKGEQCNGIILNQKNDTLLSFRPFKFGIGSFYIKPRAGEVYTAKLKFPDGSTLDQALPEVYPSGYVMQLSEINSEEIKIKVEASATNANTLYLLAYTGQNITISEKLPFSNSSSELVLNKSRLADGISRFTVFNSDGRPICERLYFKKPPAKAIVSLEVDRNEYASRQKVDLDIYIKDASQRPQVADLSLSVYRIDSLDSFSQVNIASYLWLTSELKGHIESPMYYISEGNKDVDEATNNLLLTHGWTRFKWNEILRDSDNNVIRLPEYNDHIITGKVIHSLTGKPGINKLVYLSALGKRVQVYPARSDQNGNVRFFTKDLYGHNELVVQTDAETDSMYRVDISSPFSTDIPGAPVPLFIWDKSLNHSLLNRHMNVQLQNIYTGNKLKLMYAPQIDSTAFYGLPTKKYLLDDYTRFATLEEVLREYVTEVAVDVQRKNYSLKVVGPNARGFFTDRPLILLDGVPVFNINKLIRLDPLKIKSVEALTRKYIYGPAYFEGIINFSTYKGDLGGFELAPAATVIDYEGLQMKREFYSPRYQTAAEIQNPIADFREQLFWESNAQTDASGQRHLSFYTSDQAGKYAVVVQGISASGLPIFKTTSFVVNSILSKEK